MNEALTTLEAIRQQGSETFARLGVPTRRIEAWRYTPMQGLASATETPGFAMPAVDTDEAAAGLTVQPLSLMDGPIPDLLLALESESPAQAFSALNDAALTDALVIHVAAGQDGGRLGLDWGEPAEGDLLNARVLLILEPGARLELSESYRRDGHPPLNVVIQADLAHGAQLVHSRLQSDGQDDTLITRTVIDQAGESRYSYTGLDLGTGLARHDLQSRLNGEGAHCELNGAYLPTAQAHVDNHLEIEHRAPNASSNQFYRGVMSDRSKAVFNGRVHVHEGADGAEARQSNANLLLSDHAEVNTKPELEIETDEVVASHGATVGQLDEDAVFYLRSRGIDDATARSLLTTAFCQAVVDAMPEGDARDQFTRILTQHLERGS